MDTKGTFSVNLPHFAVCPFVTVIPYKWGNRTLQVVGGVWDSSPTASKYPHDEKEGEIINRKLYLPGF